MKHQYWVLATLGCNLDCTYCFEKGKIAGSKPTYSPRDLFNFIASGNGMYLGETSWCHQAAKPVTDCPESFDGLVWTGGEPLTNQDFIRKFNELSEASKRKLGLEQVLQTNGTLLNRIDGVILRNLKYILVSLDGPEAIHNKNRGKGTYKKVVDNLAEIKPRFSGQVLARITAMVDPNFSIYDSIVGLEGITNTFHWQVETPMSKRSGEQRTAFLERYKSDLNELIGYWLGKLQRREFISIIPFETIVRRVIFERGKCSPLPFGNRDSGKLSVPACGAGKNLVAIDLKGDCYGCDTLFDDPKAKIGNIHDGIRPEKFISHLSRLSEEKLEFDFSEKPGCVRRCFDCVPPEEFDFYCQSQGVLREAIRLRMMDIWRLDSEVLRRFELPSRISEYTEQIP
jgi:radical SAM protein with 4Fe4S-binding SPASM domain